MKGKSKAAVVRMPVCVCVCVCLWVHLHFGFHYQDLETSVGRVRKEWTGAASPPIGIVALELAGSYLTSTWISFDSRSEGEEKPP